MRDNSSPENIFVDITYNLKVNESNKMFWNDTLKFTSSQDSPAPEQAGWLTEPAVMRLVRVILLLLDGRIS